MLDTIRTQPLTILGRFPQGLSINDTPSLNGSFLNTEPYLCVYLTRGFCIPQWSLASIFFWYYACF